MLSSSEYGIMQLKEILIIPRTLMIHHVKYYSNVSLKKRKKLMLDTCVLVNQSFSLEHLGVEGSLYGELIRSRDMMDYMLFPRILGLAERAWHKGAWEDIEDDEKRKEAMNDDWQRFARIVGAKELRRLDDLGVKYRISPAGAK